jgi:hypothetical protein
LMDLENLWGVGQNAVRDNSIAKDAHPNSGHSPFKAADSFPLKLLVAGFCGGGGP